MKKIVYILLFGHLCLAIKAGYADNQSVPRFSLNVGGITTLSLSPATTFVQNHTGLRPHPSNSRRYDEKAELLEKVDQSLNNNTVTSNICSDSEFGVEFYCDPNWNWRRVEDAILIIISEKPLVTMSITKINSPFKFLGQVSNVFLKEKMLYQDGFQTERVQFLGGEAVHVKAVSMNFPDIRLSDYFFIRNNALYGVLFSVHPKNEWVNYQFTIQKIVQSFTKLIL